MIFKLTGSYEENTPWAFRRPSSILVGVVNIFSCNAYLRNIFDLPSSYSLISVFAYLTSWDPEAL